ncbi:excalibur calcium-binding domain-containing protein [Saccharibacillus brassicae]|uniref:Excalibur calcium-binding domain-containing protein n=2 Tax=Saccharibacillus brassicae TaxID=2583377 RepID=A0A4Y6V6F5_SACBS|nr:excalibur calcium-binding domain-containing protein [Saccharibacillus brassicae]
MIWFVWKRFGVVKRTVGVLWAFFILLLTVTPKEAAVEPVTATTSVKTEAVQSQPAQPAKSKSLVSDIPKAAAKSEVPVAKQETPKEPTAAEWQANHKKIVMNETQSYIELSVRQTLSKDRYESAVDVVKTYADKIDDADKASFQKLAAAVEADDLEGAKKIYTSIGGEYFSELKAATPTPIIKEAPKKEPAASPAPAPVKEKQPEPKSELKPAPAAAAVEPEPEAAPVPDVYFANCDAVRAAGADPIYEGDPGYSHKLDRDRDGVGCEK